MVNPKVRYQKNRQLFDSLTIWVGAYNYKLKLQGMLNYLEMEMNLRSNGNMSPYHNQLDHQSSISDQYQSEGLHCIFFASQDKGFS